MGERFTIDIDGVVLDNGREMTPEEIVDLLRDGEKTQIRANELAQRLEAVIGNRIRLRGALAKIVLRKSSIEEIHATAREALDTVEGGI